MQFLHKLTAPVSALGTAPACMAGNPQRQPDRHAVPVCAVPARAAGTGGRGLPRLPPGRPPKRHTAVLSGPHRHRQDHERALPCPESHGRGLRGKAVLPHRPQHHTGRRRGCHCPAAGRTARACPAQCDPDRQGKACLLRTPRAIPPACRSCAPTPTATTTASRMRWPPCWTAAADSAGPRWPRRARQFTVCPFELGLDLSEWCDVVIGDYNYLFDPVVHLKRSSMPPATGCS